MEKIDKPKFLEQKFVLKKRSCVQSAARERHSARNFSSLIQLARCWEELWNFQGQADIAGDFQRAAEEGALRVKLAFRHLQPVLVSEVKGHIGLFDSTCNQLAGAIGYFQGVHTCLFACDIPLKCLIHVGSCRRIEKSY